MEIIVAVDQNWGIGRGTDLLLPISADLKRFRLLTLDKTIVYGRKTLESFPGHKPLPKRRNIVLSRAMEAEEGLEVVRNYSELYEAIKGCDEVKLIGGATVYRNLLGFCSSAEVTYIHHAFDDVEHYFPKLDETEHWVLIHESEVLRDEKSGIDFSYRRYENKQPRALDELPAQVW